MRFVACLMLVLMLIVAFPAAAGSDTASMRIGVRITGQAALPPPALPSLELAMEPGEDAASALSRAAAHLSLSSAQLSMRPDALRAQPTRAQGIWERADGRALLQVVAAAGIWKVTSHWQAR